MADTVDFSDPLVVSESRRIAAPAHELFELLADPGRHQDVDGSSMVRDSDAPPIEGIGDTFVVRMHNDEFGDYEMRNHVVEYVPDRAIAWAPKRHDVDEGDDEEDWDHRWGWRLVADGASTDVTAYFDCTRVPESGQRILHGGERWRPVLVRSLERLELLAVGAG